MDHRAVKQAERINSQKSPVLQFCGGSVSPEMQAPKVLFENEKYTSELYLIKRN